MKKPLMACCAAALLLPIGAESQQAVGQEQKSTVVPKYGAAVSNMQPYSVPSPGSTSQYQYTPSYAPAGVGGMTSGMNWSTPGLAGKTGGISGYTTSSTPCSKQIQTLNEQNVALNQLNLALKERISLLEKTLADRNGK